MNSCSFRILHIFQVEFGIAEVVVRITELRYKWALQIMTHHGLNRKEGNKLVVLPLVCVYDLDMRIVYCDMQSSITTDRILKITGLVQLHTNSFC